MVNDDIVLNVSQAAEYLGSHPETVRRLARRGEIPAFKLGTEWRFSKEALRRWFMEARPVRESVSVLVVDDDPEVVHFLSRMAEVLGCQSRGAESGVAALESVSQAAPDLIFLDLSMPVMNGPEFLTKLRATHPDLPVVIVTGYPDSEMMHIAAQHAPLMLLTKPVEPAQVERTLRTVLGDRLHTGPAKGAGGG